MQITRMDWYPGSDRGPGFSRWLYSNLTIGDLIHLRINFNDADCGGRIRASVELNYGRLYGELYFQHKSYITGDPEEEYWVEEAQFRSKPYTSSLKEGRLIECITK